MRFLSYADLAAEGRISSATLARRVRDGTGPKITRIGRLCRVAEADAAEWFQGQRGR